MWRKPVRKDPKPWRRSLTQMGMNAPKRFKESYVYNDFPYQATPVACAGNAAQAGTLAIKLDSLLNIGNYQGLFDLYKILSFKVKFVPRFNDASAAGIGVGGVALPVLYIAPNTNMYQASPLSKADIVNDDGLIIHRLDTPLELYLKCPKPALITPDPSQVLGFQFDRRPDLQPWLSLVAPLDQSGITHHGYRWFLDNTFNPNAITVDTFIEVTFDCKEQD